ncbi:hypothetical protein [Kitasatospora aureofaciens]|uniref:hypothetical protein n=1 Tax=Kitasatospora aureofaciens TaxID=1894 RepID=UPI00068C0948|nr:hypothetical protein [Kitasatospora aureofaciens]
MALTDNQLSSLADFAALRTERMRSQPVPLEAMRVHLDTGQATLLGGFPGAPVRYLDRWWRAGEDCWEPLNEAAGALLDEDARRWALAAQAAHTADPV